MIGFAPIVVPNDPVGWEAVPWVPHPEVWMLVLAAVSIGFYASRILQPKAVAAGYPPISARQKIWFVVGVVSVWLASDYPMHDIAEDHLYAVHMLQHLLLSMLIPACFVLATPRWLIELVLPPSGRGWLFLEKASRPIVAGLVFNALTMFLHWSQVVQWSADSGAVHFLFHLMVFAAGLLMWIPVAGPIPEWRLSAPAQCIYLFTMSLVPTVPGGWLVFAEGVVYRHYDTVERLWGIDVLADQQAAGAVMKLVGGMFLWIVIAIIFGRWAQAEGEKDRQERLARHRETLSTLTYDDVSKAFEQTPAPAER